jgi:hypothetical protein
MLLEYPLKAPPLIWWLIGPHQFFGVRHFSIWLGKLLINIRICKLRTLGGNEFTSNFDLATILGKFEGIRLQIDDDLLYPFFVRLDHVVALFSRFHVWVCTFALGPKSNEIAWKVNLLALGLVALHWNGLLNHPLHVEFLQMFIKLTSFYLGIT